MVYLNPLGIAIKLEKRGKIHKLILSFKNRIIQILKQKVITVPQFTRLD